MFISDKLAKQWADYHKKFDSGPILYDPLDKQVGGSHYKKYAIQPVEYAMLNNLNYCQANAIKYITRYSDKGGIEDLRKAIHNIEILIELEQKGGRLTDEPRKAAEESFENGPQGSVDHVRFHLGGR